jgi:hypothetical protein
MLLSFFPCFPPTARGPSANWQPSKSANAMTGLSSVLVLACAVSQLIPFFNWIFDNAALASLDAVFAVDLWLYWASHILHPISTTAICSDVVSYCSASASCCSPISMAHLANDSISPPNAATRPQVPVLGHVLSGPQRRP